MRPSAGKVAIAATSVKRAREPGALALPGRRQWTIRAAAGHRFVLGHVGAANLAPGKRHGVTIDTAIRSTPVTGLALKQQPSHAREQQQQQYFGNTETEHF